MFLSVHFSQDDVKRADDRHHVRHEAAADHHVQSLQIDKRWRADTNPVGLRRIIAHNVIAELALGGFDRYIRFAHGRLHYLAYLAHDGSGWDLVHGLADNA